MIMNRNPINHYGFDNQQKSFPCSLPLLQFYTRTLPPNLDTAVQVAIPIAGPIASSTCKALVLQLSPPMARGEVARLTADAPSQSLVILHLPPPLLQLCFYWVHCENGDDDDKKENEWLDNSAEDDLEGGLTEEICDNSEQKFIYDSGGEFEVVAPGSGSAFESDGVVYQPIEHDDENNSQTGYVSQSIGEDYEQAESDGAGGAFTTKLASPNPSRCQLP
jgi:hypothetical protein